ncbi:MAG: RAMP superfamily CRISPR-associated protein [Vulcanimicrobiota bacterium]
MNHPWQKFELAYVTIELTSAFLITAGDSDQLFDAVFVTDANGLPCIPGESLAGILRHAIAGDGDPERDPTCRQLFGYQERQEGQASRLRVSYAHVHDKNDQPVPFRGAKMQEDQVLAALQAGVGRDHVRIGKDGVAELRGKFDELVIPAGARFTFELAVARDGGYTSTKLLQVLARGDVRLGGKTRRGLGKFRVVRAISASFDLSQKGDVQKLGQLPVALEEAVKSNLLKSIPVPEITDSPNRLHGELRLNPVGTWMIGGGIPTGREPQRSQDKPWDRVPLSEARIKWENNKGQVDTNDRTPYLLPASSIKGAVRHRSAFHARRLSKEWYDPNKLYGEFTKQELLLFGDIRNKEDGMPGRVYFSDVYIPNATLQALQHVSLDRFTQGPMDHRLYDELALVGGELVIEITIDIEKCKDDCIAVKALDCALRDLCEGRLALGAGRGHGRFQGTLTWKHNKKLVQEEAAVC